MLLEIRGVDIWSYDQTHTIIIPTNTFGIMGAGLALQAKTRFPGIQDSYQSTLKTMDDKSKPVRLGDYKSIILCPTKYYYQDPSPLELVVKNLKILATYKDGPFAIPELGCGLGRLTWDDVHQHYQVLRKIPDTEWVVIHPTKNYTRGITCSKD